MPTTRLYKQQNIAAEIPAYRRCLSSLSHIWLPLFVVSHTHGAAIRLLRIAYLFTSGTMASMWMAKESGGFKQTWMLR